MNIPIEKQKEFIKEFETIRPDYLEFAKLLDTILTKAVEKFGFLALVQSRAKGVASFSEKIISKDKYTNPLIDMTDLCGARVIVHFKNHVEKVCSFIMENFEVDEANSLDLKSRLKVSEFGYRSIHYVITLKKDNILGVHVEEKFKSMKAEVQVRTLAEHIWADISHDRIYKTNLNIPEEWRREAARLSAILENADITFAKMANDIDSVSTVFELQYETKKATTEIEKLKTLITVLENEAEECLKNVLKLTSIYRAMDKFSEAGKVLKPWLDKPLLNQFLSAKIHFEYGVVLLLSSNNDKRSNVYTEGMKFIKQSLELIRNLPIDVQQNFQQEQSYIYYRYGRLLQRNDQESWQLADQFSVSYNIMPENPLYFVSLMESLVLRNLDMAKYNISLFKANIQEAIPKIKELIEIGIKRVPAWFAIGHCYIMLDDEFECIKAYSNAIEIILNDAFLTSHTTIDAEMELVGKFKALNPQLSEQIKLYLNIAINLTVGSSNKRYKNDLKQRRIKKEPFKTPLVIVAGGASLMDKTKITQYQDYIRELMHNFRGTIISGGTTAGIPGLVGEIKSELEKQSSLDFELIAYLPHKIPVDAIKSRAYDLFYETDSDHFSVLDILSCWCDLVGSGISPADVILIGIEGGSIASMEYQIALSLGAKVALVVNTGRASSDFILDKTSTAQSNLLQLPKDPLTVWALVNQSAETILTTEEIKTLAPIAHEFYRQKRLGELNPKAEDINKYKVLMPWNKLDTSLQHSNLMQVTFYEHILKRLSLSIRKAENPLIFNIKATLSDTEYDFLAKLEHARWNAERLLEGWKFGEKNIAAKLNPCITAWENLDIETKRYDYEPIDNIPLLLSKIGYEVYKDDF